MGSDGRFEWSSKCTTSRISQPRKTMAFDCSRVTGQRYALQLFRHALTKRTGNIAGINAGTTGMITSHAVEYRDDKSFVRHRNGKYFRPVSDPLLIEPLLGDCTLQKPSITRGQRELTLCCMDNGPARHDCEAWLAMSKHAAFTKASYNSPWVERPPAES